MRAARSEPPSCYLRHPRNSSFPDGCRGADFGERAREPRIIRRGVEFDDPDRARFVPTEREIGDVHRVAAEDRADLADDARLVCVLDDEKRSLERRFDLDAIEQRQARPRRFEDRTFQPPLSLARVDLDRNDIGEVPRAGTVRLDDLDAPLGRDLPGIDDRDGLGEEGPQ